MPGAEREGEKSPESSKAQPKLGRDGPMGQAASRDGYPNIPESAGILHPEQSHPPWKQPRAVTRPWGHHSHILMGRGTPARSGKAGK